MSGAPVLDEQTSSLVGMVTTADEARGVFQIIPFKQLCKVAEPARLLFPIRPDQSQDVFNRLLRLDYTLQIEAILGFKGKPPCALSIHGERYFGHMILIRRILTVWGIQPKEFLPIDLGSLNPAPMKALVLDLGRSLGIEPKKITLNAVLGKLLGKLKYGHVVLRAFLGPATTAELLETFFCEFWKPLIAQSSSQKGSVRQHKLLLLLVDEGERQEDWPPFKVPYEPESWNAMLPINLPRLQKIPQDVIKVWPSSEASEILELMPFDVVAERIYRLSNEGVPEDIFDAFCWLYGSRWRDEMGRCNKWT